MTAGLRPPPSPALPPQSRSPSHFIPQVWGLSAISHMGKLRHRTAHRPLLTCQYRPERSAGDSSERDTRGDQDETSLSLLCPVHPTPISTFWNKPTITKNSQPHCLRVAGNPGSQECLCPVSLLTPKEGLAPRLPSRTRSLAPQTGSSWAFLPKAQKGFPFWQEEH